MLHAQFDKKRKYHYRHMILCQSLQNTALCVMHKILAIYPATCRSAICCSCNMLSSICSFVAL